MEPITTIEVRDLKLITVNILDLVSLQPEAFKELSDDHYTKLRNSIVRRKFSFPLFVWIDENGTQFVADGHQRVRTLKKMQEEGITIPLLPALQIQADNRVQAKELLLLHESRYGKQTREGFDAFIDEVGYEVGTDIEDLLVMPDVEYFDEPKEQIDGGNPNKSREIECPSCHMKIKLFGNNEVELI